MHNLRAVCKPAGYPVYLGFRFSGRQHRDGPSRLNTLIRRNIPLFFNENFICEPDWEYGIVS